jgi:hypothetical protein
VKPLLRRFIIGAVVIASIAVIAVGWIVLSFSGCDYRLIYARPSPSDRYEAALYSAECGMAESGTLLILRDRSALGLRSVEGRPAGTAVATRIDVSDPRADVFWEAESALIVQYGGDDAPELERAEWGGVRIVVRRAPHQP